MVAERLASPFCSAMLLAHLPVLAPITYPARHLFTRPRSHHLSPVKLTQPIQIPLTHRLRLQPCGEYSSPVGQSDVQRGLAPG